MGKRPFPGEQTLFQAEDVGHGLADWQWIIAADVLAIEKLYDAPKLLIEAAGIGQKLRTTGVKTNHLHCRVKEHNAQGHRLIIHEPCWSFKFPSHGELELDVTIRNGCWPAKSHAQSSILSVCVWHVEIQPLAGLKPHNRTKSAFASPVQWEKILWTHAANAIQAEERL
jgi:hypothetical protein